MLFTGEERPLSHLLAEEVAFPFISLPISFLSSLVAFANNKGKDKPSLAH